MSPATITLPPLRRARLENGLVVIVAERPQLPLITLRLSLRAGSSRDPAAHPGTAAFTGRLLQKGAGSRDARQFAEDLDGIGGLFGAAIGLDQLAVDAEFTTRSWEAGLELFLDALCRPRFDEAECARERDLALAEIAQSHDDPDHVADRAYQCFLFAGHSYGHPAEGTEGSLASINAARTRAFWSRVAPTGGALVVAGDVRADVEIARLSEALAAWPSSEPSAPLASAPDQPGGRVVLVHDPGASQAQWRAGNVGQARSLSSYHELVLANAILGGAFTSRLMQAVRVERGLTYGIGSRFVLGLSRGPFVMTSFTKNESVVELHEVAARVLSSFRRDGATGAELDAARAYLIGQHLRRLETTDGLAAALSEAEFFGLGDGAITGYIANLHAVTLDRLNAAIPELFPENLLTVVAGDADEIAGPCAKLGDVHVVGSDHAESATA